MDPEIRNIWSNMRDLGLSALAHANLHAAEISFDNARWSDLSVLQAAHAAEMLVKSRIAYEHPLLIFKEIPSPTKKEVGVLTEKDLFESGRTIEWKDLLGRLWATTGIKIDFDKFLGFGKYRNAIQHFAPPRQQSPVLTDSSWTERVDSSEKVLRFIYEVVDPFINECWDLFAIDQKEFSWRDSYGISPKSTEDNGAYLGDALIAYQIPFLISPSEACKNYSYLNDLEDQMKRFDEIITNSFELDQSTLERAEKSKQYYQGQLSRLHIAKEKLNEFKKASTSYSIAEGTEVK